jgi:hypothetical protein
MASFMHSDKLSKRLMAEERAEALAEQSTLKNFKIVRFRRVILIKYVKYLAIFNIYLAVYGKV